MTFLLNFMCILKLITFIIYCVCAYVCHDVYAQVSGLPVCVYVLGGVCLSFCRVDFSNRTFCIL